MVFRARFDADDVGILFVKLFVVYFEEIMQIVVQYNKVEEIQQMPNIPCLQKPVSTLFFSRNFLFVIK